MDSLRFYVIDKAILGYEECSNSLGIARMPTGYALISDPDHSYYFWIRQDGVESVKCKDRWAAYRGAKEDYLKESKK